MAQAEFEARFARALVDPDMPVPAGLTTARGEADARRFAVYRNNVHVSLVEALARSFPVTARIVGDEFFRAMARAYVGLEKPRSAVLIGYGSGFADFVASFPPAAGLPYLADVARLEFAWLEAYHAADAPPLSAAALAALPPDDLAGACFVAHPAARLIASPYAIGAIWRAHQGEGRTRISAATAEAVLVTRPGQKVQCVIVPEASLTFWRELLAGRTILEAAEHAASDSDEFDVGHALSGLVMHGALREVRLSPGGEDDEGRD